MYGYFMLGTKMLFGLFLRKKKKKKSGMNPTRYVSFSFLHNRNQTHLLNK